MAEGLQARFDQLKHQQSTKILNTVASTSNLEGHNRWSDSSATGSAPKRSRLILSRLCPARSTSPKTARKSARLTIGGRRTKREGKTGGGVPSPQVQSVMDSWNLVKQRIRERSTPNYLRLQAVGAKDASLGERVHQVFHAGRTVSMDPLLVQCVAIFRRTVFSVTHSTRAQHLLSWEETIVDPDGNELPPGTVNLYAYPMCTIKSGGVERAEEATGATLEALGWLIAELAVGAHAAFYRPDASGGLPIHALAIANTKESLNLVVDLCRGNPRLVMQAHGPGLFLHETLLHILAVNRQQDLLLELLRQAEMRLSRRQFAALLDLRADGAFFSGSPMLFYGATALGFAASFGLSRVAVAILDADLRGAARRQGEPSRLSCAACACSHTGFLPLHCAVVNGQIPMYDLLAGISYEKAAAPGEIRVAVPLLAEPSQRTVGNVGMWSHLTPLQLAAKIGDVAMTKHLLRNRLVLNWKWGPLSSYRLDLAQIDSVNPGSATSRPQEHNGNDLVELVADFRARLQTQSLLLPEFMQGFLFELVLQKWKRYTRYAFYSQRAAELIYLVSLTWLSFQLKLQQEYRPMYIAVPILAMGLLLNCLEVLFMVLWWR